MEREGNKISINEYLASLQIVKQYHTQLMEESEVIIMRLSGVSITAFLKSETKISTRLYNLLLEYRATFYDCAIGSINRSSFLRLRSAGEKSWDEFLRARLEYMQKIDP